MLKFNQINPVNQTKKIKSKYFNLIIKIFLFLSLFSVRVFAQMPDAGAQGNWLTIDDETSTPRSVIQLSTQNGELSGKVTKIYLQPGEKNITLCTKCTDAAHKDKPIVGMTVVWGLKQDGFRKWKDGYILDPHNGKIYRCQMTLAPNGQELIVRGYIGFSLIGRSQVWMRVGK